MANQNNLNLKQQLDLIYNSINEKPKETIEYLMQNGATPEVILEIILSGVQEGKINPLIGEAIIKAILPQQSQLTQTPQTVAARHGAKLNYLKSLKNQCPEGQEPYYYKKGGMVKCGCSGKKLEDGGEVKKENAVTKFKKIRKAATGTTAPQPKPKRKVTEYEKGRTELAKDLGWGADTVHVAGKPYSLTNDKGKRLNTSYPEYGKRLYQADMKSNKKDAKARVQKADEASAYKQGSKIKKHYDGGILNLLFKK